MEMIITKDTAFASVLTTLDYMHYEEQSRKVGGVVWYVIDIPYNEARRLLTEFNANEALCSSQRLILEYKRLVAFTKRLDVVKENDIERYAIDLGIKML